MPFIEMHKREISYPSNSEFGVPVAPRNVVSLVGVKTAIRGRSGASGSCYNRRRINDLGYQVAGAKMNQHFHRHPVGVNVKWITPRSPESL